MVIIYGGNGRERIVSAGTRAACLRNGVSYDVPRARKSRLNAYLKIRPTSYRMTHRYARLRCFYRPPVGQKKPPGPGGPLDGTLHLPDARLYRSVIYRTTALTRVNDYTRLRSISDFFSLYDLMVIKTSTPFSEMICIISIDIYEIRQMKSE